MKRSITAPLSIYLSHLSGDPSPTGPYPTGPSAASWSRHRQTSPLPTPGTPAVWDPRTPSGRIGSRTGFMTTAEPNAPQPPGPRPDPGTSVVVAWMVQVRGVDRKSTRLNSSHVEISYAVFCLK